MRALPPNDAIAAATFFSSFSLRASKRSSPAPASAISLAIAAPTPLDAPVTRTVLPLISMRVLPGSFPLRPNSSCPLWVKSGHRTRSAPCPLYPQPLTLVAARLGQRHGCDPPPRALLQLGGVDALIYLPIKIGLSH